jgi:hypothetical protein
VKADGVKLETGMQIVFSGYAEEDDEQRAHTTEALIEWVLCH